MSWLFSSNKNSNKSQTSHNGNGNYRNHAPAPQRTQYQSQRNGNSGYNGRYQNQTNTRGYNGRYQNQTQTQRFAYKADQTQKTADMQMFKEQVNNTFISICEAAKMFQDPQWDETIVNSATDGAVLTLDMFAVSCGEFCKKADKDALDLAKKNVYDKWNALKRKDEAIYHLTTKYRDFLIASLNGNKNLRFKSYRVASSKLDLDAEKALENNPKALHDTYQHLIVNSQQFDAEQRKNRSNPAIIKKYKKGHDEELKQFRGNKRYQNQETLHTQHGHYEKPKQNEFYFTKSGQNASFDGLDSKAKRKQAQNEIESDVFGDISAYHKLPEDLAYPQNAVLLLSKKSKLRNCTKHIPCKVLYPKNKDKVCQMIVVRPAFPFNDAKMKYPVNMLCFDVKKVKRLETQHIKQYGKLGYDSIDDIESQMDLDEFE